MGDLVQFRLLKAPAQSEKTHNEMILDRIRGIPANVSRVDPNEQGYPINRDPNTRPVA